MADPATQHIYNVSEKERRQLHKFLLIYLLQCINEWRFVLLCFLYIKGMRIQEAIDSLSRVPSFFKSLQRK